MPQLPLELVLDVLDAVGQETTESEPVALRASHVVTQTLCSFARVCKATSHRSRCYLLSKCLYIDHPSRLSQLLTSLDFIAHRPDKQAREVFASMRSMYLAPFTGLTIDDLPVAQWTFQLLALAAPSLERLTVSIDLSSLEPWADHLNVIPILESAFRRLFNLREFACTASDLHFPRYGAAADPLPLWLRWTRLERLALFNPGMARIADIVAAEKRLPPRLTNIALGFSTALTDSNAQAFARNHEGLLWLPADQRLRVWVLHPAVPAQHRNALNRLHAYSVRSAEGDGAISVVGGQAPDPSVGMSINELCEYYQTYFREVVLSGEVWRLGGLFLGERRSALSEELP